MNSKTAKTVNVLIWVCLGAYLVFAVRYCSKREADIVCSGFNVVVKDSAGVSFVSAEGIEKTLVENGLAAAGKPLDSIDLLAVERVVEGIPFVRRADVFTSINGKLNIHIQQRVPILRVQAENGYRFYLSSDGYVLPLSAGSHVHVPIVTGSPEFPFGKEYHGPVPPLDSLEKKSEKNYFFLQNLINFVKFLGRDPFWGAQIVQINILPGNEVELIPRVGSAEILLGDPEDHAEKLEKLFRFYRKGLAYEGWEKYGYINIKFKDQVICTK